MKIKCDYCGNTYEEFQKNCPSCGAPNPSHHDGDVQPRTIEELKKWYEDRHLPPPEKTRFFIGIDYKQPRAFGIYKNGDGDFVVYKNKADGTRAVRYKGKDETYAVDELYQKLKDEIVHQKNLSHNRSRTGTYQRQRQRKQSSHIVTAIVIIWFCIAIGVALVGKYQGRHNGYYSYDDTYYYNDSSTWYYYDDDYDDWYVTTTPSQYDPEYTDPYFMGRAYEDIDWEISDKDFILSAGGNLKEFTDVKDSASYQDNHHTTSSDSDYDWDSGSDSWDSGGTDWDSDW